MPYKDKNAQIAHRKAYRQRNLEALRARDRERARVIAADPVLRAEKAKQTKEYRRKRREDPAVYEAELAEQRAYYRRRLETDPNFHAEELERGRKYKETPEAREIAAASHALRMENEEYRAERARQQMLRGRDKRRKLDLLKMGRPCYDCGGMFPPESLDWDHLPGKEKKFNISQAQSRKIDDVIDEIAKCQLVCANCHRTRTAKRGAE